MLSFSVDCGIVQGSVFRPLGFLSYSEDVAEMMDRHNVQFHLYVDDTQFLDCCRSTDTASLLNPIIVIQSQYLYSWLIGVGEPFQIAEKMLAA